jgi:hypothetical protein
MLINLSKTNNISSFKKRILIKKYDFIIIGSGPASVTLSNELIKKNYSILMIEKGNLKKSRFEKVFYKKLPVKLKSRTFVLGGTSSTWSGVSSYMTDFEIKSRFNSEFINLWPIKYSELIKYYYKLDKKYGFNYGRLIKSRNDTAPFEIRKFHFLDKPVNFRDHIKYNKIDIICNCEAMSVDDSTYGGTVNLRVNNYNLTLTSNKIIICTGGIESIKLVLNSIKDKKLKNVKNKKIIGRYYMDHPKFTLGYLRYPKINLIKKYFIKNNYYYGISLKKEIQKKLNVLNSYVRFESSKNDYDFKKKLNLYLIFKVIFIKFIKFFYTTNLIKLKVFCEMSPNFNNKIYLNKNNKIQVDYNLSKIDVKTLYLLRDTLYNYFSFFPEKENKVKFSKSFLKNNIKDASHHMGGLIYSKNKKKFLVNKNLKIAGTKNIFVCSSSVFPTSGSVNPTMTICALAVRLANYLSK